MRFPSNRQKHVKIAVEHKQSSMIATCEFSKGVGTLQFLRSSLSADSQW